MRVAVFGASGFVGSALVERLWAEAAEVRPVIHSSGNAARLARFGRPLVMADLMAPDTLGEALNGCTHVVNCSRGPAEVMTRGLQHLLDAARTAGVQRFVHLSSVAVYGDAHEGVLVESAVPDPVHNSYGHTKLQQDRMVAKAAAAGLSSVILCPPNISGAHSAFLLEIVGSMRRGQFGLVDEGRRSCELVDVGNLVHAIGLAMRAQAIDSERIFVTDGAAVTWAQVAAALAPLAETTTLPSVPLDEARRLVARAEPAEPSARRALRHLVSSEVRQALKRDAWFGQAERSMKAAVRRMPSLERKLRERFAGGPEAIKSGQGQPVSPRLLKQQLRGVTYSQERAQRLLGYSPVVSFGPGMSEFARWYGVHFGWGDEWWPLLSHLRAEG
jgi:nucleoside-diphosphate-sugar epimerase